MATYSRTIIPKHGMSRKAATEAAHKDFEDYLKNNSGSMPYEAAEEIVSRHFEVDVCAVYERDLRRTAQRLIASVQGKKDTRSSTKE